MSAWPGDEAVGADPGVVVDATAEAGADSGEVCENACMENNIKLTIIIGLSFNMYISLM